jgi:surface carbohydrate biosynthesis protein
MKIGIIVDNPIRDLSGCVLLASELLRNNNDVFLIPMYFQGFDIPILDLDLVIVNYVRKNNHDLIKNFKKNGIHVFVLDTEGGVVSNDGADSIANWPLQLMEDDKHLLIDGYFFWGELMANSFIKSKCLSKDKIFVTGNPRFDICNSKFSNFFVKKDSYILINTNFSSVNPKFTKNRKLEFQAFKTAGWNDDYINNVFNEMNISLEGIVEVTKRLLIEFPNKKFVIRPHPFESIDYYKSEFLDFSNCSIIQNENIFNAIFNSECVIHLNCGTAVESIMLNKIPISLEFLNNEFMLNHTPLPSKLSYKVNSIENLIDSIKNIEKLSYEFNFRMIYDKFIFPMFFKNDGKSAQRIANFISKKYGSEKCNDKNLKWGFNIKSFLRSIIGSYWFYKYKSNSNKNLKEKSINISEIENLLNSLRSDENKLQFSVKNAKTKFTKMPLTTIKCKLE